MVNAGKKSPLKHRYKEMSAPSCLFTQATMVLKWLAKVVGPPAPPEPVCCACCAGAPANYVAYDRAGAPLGGAQLGIPAGISCDGGGDPRLQRLWLDLGSTPVAARRDLVAAVVTTLVGHRHTPSVVPHSNT